MSRLTNPGAYWTFATAIAGDRVVGFYLDQDELATFHFHGFSLHHGHFRPIDCPGAQRVFISGVNSRNQATGSFFDAEGAQHALLVKDDACHVIDFPDSSQDYAIGINNHGEIAGRYVDANKRTHAFLRTHDREDFDDDTGHTLISVVFKTNSPFGNSPTMSGPDPAATSANRLFDDANVWNNLEAPFALIANPNWSNLVDSTGAPTGVNLSIAGTVGSTDFWGFFPTTKSLLQSPFLFWNSWTNGGGAFGPGESTTITWALTGLPPATAFDMCVYGSFGGADSSFAMTIEGTTMSIPSYNNAELPRPNCVLFRNITSDELGTISGVAAGVGDSTTAANEADWSGFQLVQVASCRERKD